MGVDTVAVGVFATFEGAAEKIDTDPNQWGLYEDEKLGRWWSLPGKDWRIEEHEVQE